MSVDLAQLKIELQVDPTLRGYAVFMAIGNHVALADLLNQIQAGISITRDTIPSWELFEAIVPSEWAALSAQEKQRMQTILSMGTVSVKGANTRNAFLASFAAGSQTRSNLAALQNRSGSRAEQLLGQAVTITQIGAALTT